MPLSDRERDLCRRIERRASAMLEDLARLVGIPTGHDYAPGLDETRAILCARLASLGAATEVRPGEARPDWLHGAQRGAAPLPTAVCRRADARAPCRILLAGHIDTVHDPEGPFRELTRSADGSRVTGPGAVDMKGGILVAVHALEALAEAGVPLTWTFVLNSDEETGSYCSDPVLKREARAHDVGLALEPAMADGGLAIERGGSGQFVIEATGRAAHVGREFEHGVSAVLALARAVLAAGELCDLPRGRIVNIGPLQGGEATNVVPDHARAWGNVRFRTDDDAAALAAGLDRIAAEAGPGLAGVRVARSFNRPAKPVTDGTLRLAHAARAAAEDLGQRLPFGATGGVCDGNILQHEGLPTVDTLGVRGGGLHTPHEWVEVASLVERCQLLAVLLGRLAESPPR